MNKTKYLWQKHRLLLIGFSLATLVTLFFLFRFVFSVIYWSYNRDLPIEPWQPLGYVAHSHQVDREWLMRQANLPEGIKFVRLTVEEAAKIDGVTYEEMRDRLTAAIAAQHAQ
ncbi:MAG: hypothetical protein COB08_015965 [Rhodobacteraceae bacterium]|nr:hypothetical protein [Paracoccaceae bacterium]